MPGCGLRRASSSPPDVIALALRRRCCAAAAPAPRPRRLPAGAAAPHGRPEPWVGEAVADSCRGPGALGVPAVSRAERLQAQAALEIPDVPLSRATSVRVAEALGATRLVTGTYASRRAPRLTCPCAS